MLISKSKIHISIYVLIPLIFSGLSIISILVSYNITTHYLRLETNPARQITWLCVYAGIIVFLCGFLILRFILNPVTKFVKEAEGLTVLQDLKSKQTFYQSKNNPEHYSQVFEQITDILGKVEAKESFPDIVGHSKVMRGIFSQILKVAQTDITVLILGESGTGKELVATSIFEHSIRKDKPFVKLNCVAIPEGLLESELFGHEKGAFTGATSLKIGKFELADGGTIFMDEIGDMLPATQAKLLRVLQEKEFERVGGNQTFKINVRIIAATNKDLSEMVKSGQFREDLFFRLNVFSIQLPPLRERREDIPLMVEHFLSKAYKPVLISSTALQLLTTYSWPGNVRELQNTIERAAVLAEDGTINPGHLHAKICNSKEKQNIDLPDNETSIDDRLKEVERDMVIKALIHAGGIQVKAAQLLGINQRSLWHRIKKHDIDVNSVKGTDSVVNGQLTVSGK